MATRALAVVGSRAAPPEVERSLRYVARQPILDLHCQVHGYELLFRLGPEASFRGDGDLATRTMLDNTVMFGLEKLTGGLPAFVNCTLDSLSEDLVRILPPSMTVLELLENLEPTPSLVATCRKLKTLGYRLALDDFAWRPGIEPLVELADYIKVDFALCGILERKRLLDRLGRAPVALIAEKVETLEDQKQASREGFALFQGYYFCRPVLLENRKVPSNRLSHIEILKLLHSDNFDLTKLEALVKQDTSLTYRLLRLVNSPLCTVRREVRSIQSALLLVGDDTFRRLATLAITSELNTGQPAEILQMVFVRGRFCELAAPLCCLDSTEQYLMGMLSLLPAMLRVPMAKLTPQLPLRLEIRMALEGAKRRERVLLDWLEFYERGEWPACDAVAQGGNLNVDELLNCYTDAVAWAESALRETGLCGAVAVGPVEPHSRAVGRI